jgi:OmpA-OmpF porin, OOP family
MMKQMLRTMMAGLFLAGLALQATPKDYNGFKDPSLFTRMPHYFLSSDHAFVETPFDAFEFMVKDGTQSVEGRHLHYTYDYDEAAGSSPGFLQIVRNYEAAAKKIGGEILSSDTRRTTIRIAKNGLETWVALEAFNGGSEYELNIIERQVMKQDVAANAAALQSGLAQDGHVEVPGIYFDSGKSEVKPESEPALKELVKLLRANPSMRVWVVGHTDSVGSPDSNVALSNARAASVIRSLAQLGIEPKRLAPHGSGPFSPVASNRTDQGRARNRRVELVEQP